MRSHSGIERTGNIVLYPHQGAYLNHISFSSFNLEKLILDIGIYEKKQSKAGDGRFGTLPNGKQMYRKFNDERIQKTHDRHPTDERSK